MITTALRSEEVISSILNMVCPECGGPMGGLAEEFKCQGRCRNDWRLVWEGCVADDPVLAPASARVTPITAFCSRGPNGDRLSSPRRNPRRHSCQGRMLRSLEPLQMQRRRAS
jgi:hypothetical protein